NLRGALETLIVRERADHAPFVYFTRIRSTSGLLDTRNRWMDAYWRFYLIKHKREDLLERTVSIDTTDVKWMPARSLVLANLGDQLTGALVGAGQLKRVAVIPEIDGPGFFLILQRLPAGVRMGRRRGRASSAPTTEMKMLDWRLETSSGA